MMRHRVIAAVGAACLMSGGALAAGDAAAGLQALRELNLTVLGTLTANGQEVEGRTFAGTLNASNYTNFGIGRVGQGSASSSTYDVLDVVNDASGSWRLKAGSANGSNATPLGNGAAVGGSILGGMVDFNDANGQLGAISAGANLTSGLNVGSHSVRYGGTAANGINGAVQDVSLAAGGTNDLKASLSTKLSALSDNLNALSDRLWGLTSLATVTGTGSALNYTGANNGYAVFTMTQAAFEDQNANFDNLFGAGSTGYTTIINVLGTGLTERGNSNGTNANQNVIWNFHDATSLSLKGFHGSVLATKADVSNSSAIEGSIVARNFTLNGEVHLGTFAGTSNFVTSAVAEPASWATMLGGFGMLGFSLRRRRRPAEELN